MKKKSTKTNKKPAPKVDTSIEDSILEAFIQVQYHKGAANVVLQDLAEKAGVAFGTVRYHFNQAGKDVAIEALLYMMKKTYVIVDEKIYQQRMNKDFNPLHAYIHAMFDWIHEYPAESSLLCYYYYLCSSQTTLVIPNHVFLQKARLRIEALVHESVGRSLYKTPADMPGIALELHASIMGTCLIAGTQRQKELYTQQKNICTALVDKILK